MNYRLPWMMPDMRLQMYYASKDPVAPQATANVGYGPGGGLPLRFRLRDDAQSDTTFFKVYVFTEKTDLSFLQQESILQVTDTLASGLGRIRGREPESSHLEDICMAAVTIAR
jgi:hypothetical protein